MKIIKFNKNIERVKLFQSYYLLNYNKNKILV